MSVGELNVVASRGGAPRPVPGDAAVRVVRVGLLGYGRVGQAVAALAFSARSTLADAGLDLQCVSALVRDVTRERSGPALPVTADADAVLRHDVDVIVEVLGGVEPARTLVATALRRGIAVVSANKTLVAHHGPALVELARRHRTRFVFDAAVVAGVPFLGSIARRPLVANPARIAGVINGTSHFVLTALAGGASFDEAIEEATRRGYAEPDSRADIGGRDAAEKLAILLQLTGCPDADWADLPRRGIDTLTPADLEAARALGGTIKPVALASLDPVNPGAWVGPAFVDAAHGLARIGGVTNALQLTSATGEVVTFSGPGAGPAVTAVTIVDDIVEAVDRERGTGRHRRAVNSRRVVSARLRTPPASAWFLSVDGHADAEVLAPLTASGIGAEAHVAHQGATYMKTSAATWPSVERAVRTLATAGRNPRALPIIDL